MASRRRQDDGFHIHMERKIANRAVARGFSVECRFVLGECRLVCNLEAMEPIHIRVAFPAGKKETQGIALLGTKSFTVLIQRDDGIIQNLFKRDASRMRPSVRTFYDDPFGLGFQVCFLQEQ